MKIQAATKFLDMLRKRMGEDLTYYLTLDTDGKYYVMVSAHNSKTRKFKNDQPVQKVTITDHDMTKQNFTLCNEINNIFDKLIIGVTENELIG